MSVKLSKVSMLTALSLGVSLFAFSSSAMAASCLSGAAKASDAKLSAFAADPSSILVDNASAGLPLSNAVRSLAASDSATLSKLLDLAKNGNAAQKAAIGAGLARAAVACTENEPNYAAQIQSEVAQLGDLEVLVAFRTASSDIATAALSGNAGTVTPAPGGDTGSGGATNVQGNTGAPSGGESTGTSTTSGNSPSSNGFTGGRSSSAVQEARGNVSPSS